MLKIGIVDSNISPDEYSDVLKKSSDFAFGGFYGLSSKASSGESIQSDFSQLSGFKELVHSCDALYFPKVNIGVYSLITFTLKQSKHVLIGNPLNLNLEAVDHLFKLADEANVILKVIQTIHYHSVLQTAIKYIRNPVYLEIQKELTNTNESLIDSLYKSVQPAVLINQNSMKKLQAVSIPQNNGTPDVINARIEFNNGCVANVTSSSYSGSEKFLCRIHQEKQHIDIDFANQSIGLTTFEDPNQNQLSDLINVPVNDPFIDELSGFATNIINNSFHLNNSENGYNTYYISRKILEKISCEFSII
jgi:predicted dehydrogenase